MLNIKLAANEFDKILEELFPTKKKKINKRKIRQKVGVLIIELLTGEKHRNSVLVELYELQNKNKIDDQEFLAWLEDEFYDVYGYDDISDLAIKLLLSHYHTYTSG